MSHLVTDWVGFTWICDAPLSYQGSNVSTVVVARLLGNSKNLSQPNLGLQLPMKHPVQGRLKKLRLSSVEHVPSVLLVLPYPVLGLKLLLVMGLREIG